MFGIGGTELFIILLIALIVLGPNKLPELAKMLGRAMGELQKATSDIKREIDISGEKPSYSSPKKSENSDDSNPQETGNPEKLQESGIEDKDDKRETT
jgi:Tat protein translocase TatB subunit